MEIETGKYMIFVREVLAMNKKGQLLVCLLMFFILSSALCAAHAQSSGILIEESFDGGETALSVRQNKKDGAEPHAEVQDGVLRLQREQGDGLIHALKEFPYQTEGVLELSLNIKTDLQNGRILALSSQPFRKVVSIELQEGALILSCDGRSAPAGFLATGEWHEIRLNLDFAAGSAVLFVNGTEAARIEGASPEGVRVFEMALSEQYGYICVDQLKLHNWGLPEELFYDIANSSAAADICEVAQKGIMTGVGGGAFSPDTTLTRAQMAQIIARTLELSTAETDAGYNDVSPGDWYAEAVCAVTQTGIMEGADGYFYPDKLLNFEEAAKILTSSAEYAGVPEAADAIAENFDFLYAGKGLSDREAVEYDAQTLKIGGGQMVFDHLVLPQKGEYGSDISWNSSSNSVASDGRVTRPGGAPEKVELTAQITKGAESRSKTFLLTVMPCDVEWVTTATGTTDSELLVTQRGDNINILYDVTPKAFPLNTVMAFASRESAATAFGQMPVIVRFNEEGCIDAYNGTAYTADKRMEYSEGTTYTVRLAICLSSKTYSVWVKPQGRPETQIAANYLFRSGSMATENIGKFYMKYGSATVDGAAVVTKMTVAAPEEVIGAEAYPYNANYADADTGEQQDSFSRLRETKMVTENLSLPTVDAKGREIVWVSSDEGICRRTGELAGDRQENISFHLTAVTLDGSASAYALISRKDEISGWAFGYIASAMNMGLIQDVMLKPDFEPKMSVTREYAAVLINRLLHLI